MKKEKQNIRALKKTAKAHKTLSEEKAEKKAEKSKEITEKLLDEETKKETKEREAPPVPRSDDEIPKSEFELIQDAILDVCKIEITRQNQGPLLSVVRTMQNKARAPTDIIAFGKWWLEYDFRGQKGSCPAVSQISSEWPKFEDFKKNGASKNGHRQRSAGSKPSKRKDDEQPEWAEKYVKALE